MESEISPRQVTAVALEQIRSVNERVLNDDLSDSCVKVFGASISSIEGPER